MTSLAARSPALELMDTEPVGYAEFAECLRDLERINRLTLAYRPTLAFLEEVARSHPGRALTILDAGSGGGDMLRVVARWAAQRGVEVSLIGADLNPFSRQAAEAATSQGLPIEYVTANIFDYAPERPIDLILSSLFTHHLNEEQLRRFLAWMEQRATLGWCINDLHRHWLPYHFIKRAAPLLSRNRLIRHDAPLSVARAFTRADWEAVPTRGLALRWWFPFRWTLARLR